MKTDKAGHMKGTVYILLSLKDRRTYIGSTADLKRRINEHNLGNNISTKNRRPFTLVYSENYDNLMRARQREKYLKSRNGRREVKKILTNIGE